MAQRKWLHGFLELCLLSMLAERRDYGRGLSERLVVAGFDEIPGGTLYPALMRLEKRGLVAVSWRPSVSGPARKYYELTDAGRAELTAQRAQWRAFSSAVGTLINGLPVRTETSSAPYHSESFCAYCMRILRPANKTGSRQPAEHTFLHCRMFAAQLAFV